MHAPVHLLYPSYNFSAVWLCLGGRIRREFATTGDMSSMAPLSWGPSLTCLLFLLACASALQASILLGGGGCRPCCRPGNSSITGFNLERSSLTSETNRQKKSQSCLCRGRRCRWLQARTPNPTAADRARERRLLSVCPLLTALCLLQRISNAAWSMNSRFECPPVGACCLRDYKGAGAY